MKIFTIKDIIRKDVPIYYRRLYTGVAVMELAKDQADYRIDFAIEQKPTGGKEISITLIDKVDYPLLPITKELKIFINSLETNGGLPD